MKSGQIEQFKQLSQFKDTQDFNNNIEQWLVDIKTEFTKGELVALKRLIRYACKFAGVSNAKIQTIVSATHKEAMGISRSTFERMLRKAKKLGLIEVQHTKRGNFQGHNVYVFLPYPSNQEVQETNTNEVDEQVKIEGANKTNLLSKTNNQSNNKRYDELDHTFTLKSVPERFTSLVSCFYDKAKTIEEYWYMAKIAAYKNSMEQDQEALLNVAIDSFKQMIRKSKKFNLTKPVAYFYKIAYKTFDNLFHEQLFEECFWSERY